MHIFGDEWLHHADKIQSSWEKTITQEDLILLPGDLSWAMKDKEANKDLSFIAKLPGTKILLRGNHDYWWGTRSKVEKMAGETCYVLQNNAIEMPDFVIVGSRGWTVPGTPSFTEEDNAIYRREIERLRLSLQEGAKYQKKMLAMMHFPPALSTDQPSAFTDLLEEYGVSACVYGHLHGRSHQYRLEGTIRTIKYQLVSADFLSFVPLEITAMITSFLHE